MTTLASTMEAYGTTISIRRGVLAASMAGLVGFVALWLFMVNGDTVVLAWMAFVALLALILAKPRYGYYATLWIAVASDFTLQRWNPFTTNFSSDWSIFYLGGWAVFSPQEVCLALIVLAWLVRAMGARRLRIELGELGLPVLVFAVAVILGLGYGIATHGSINIALWESRYMFYLPLSYLIACNVLDHRRQTETLTWMVMTALFYEGIAGIVFVGSRLGWDIGSVQAITDHAAAIHMNALFVLIILTVVYGGSWARKLLLPVMALPVLFTYVATQRRAAFVAVAVALACIALVMFMNKRTLFWYVVPLASVMGVLYLAAFWNSGSPLGMPARAIKSATVGSAEEAHSDDYRDIENVNLSFTLHQKPLTGIGFGKKFYVLVQLPDISFFPMWEYIPHNSVLWIWLKMGAYGFVAYAFMVGMTLVKGAQVVRALDGGAYLPVVLTWTLYVLMHFIFAYVDMSWDAQSSVLLGMSMAVIGRMERLLRKPLPVPPHPPYWGPGHVAI